MGLKQELESDVEKIYKSTWTTRDGRKIPSDSDITSGNDGVNIEAAILYADLDESTKLVDNYEKTFAAEQYKAFLQCATKIIRSQGGEIRSFDGDRVMGVFFGETKCTDAVRAGLKINGAVNGIIQPKLKESYPNTKYVMKHVVGIDVSNVLAIKAGIRNSNDLAWIGKAANHAAKLTGQDASSPTWITDKVYDVMTDAVKYSSGDPKVNMWKQWKWTSQNNRRIYSSTWLIHV